MLISSHATGAISSNGIDSLPTTELQSSREINGRTGGDPEYARSEGR